MEKQDILVRISVSFTTFFGKLHCKFWICIDELQKDSEAALG
jgi:hypothetical protein